MKTQVLKTSLLSSQEILPLMSTNLRYHHPAGLCQDRVDPANHLRSLSEEIGRIRDALQAAEQAGLCQVLIEANASADRISRSSRIARYRTVLQSFTMPATPTAINCFWILIRRARRGQCRGLRGLLGQQRALELVFLNGCSTEQQVQDCWMQTARRSSPPLRRSTTVWP